MTISYGRDKDLGWEFLGRGLYDPILPKTTYWDAKQD